MVDKAFAYHKPSPSGLSKVATLREAYSVLAKELKSLCPPSRELSTALTNLETSAMWGIKAIVFNDPESTVEE